MLCKNRGFHGGYYKECRLLCRYAVWLVGTDVSEECIASIIWMTRIEDLRTALGITSNRITLRRNSMMMEAITSSETSVLAKASRHTIPEDGILHGNQTSDFMKAVNCLSLLPNNNRSSYRQSAVGLLVRQVWQHVIDLLLLMSVIVSGSESNVEPASPCHAGHNSRVIAFSSLQKYIPVSRGLRETRERDYTTLPYLHNSIHSRLHHVNEMKYQLAKLACEWVTEFVIY
jgi:hypothetical protein